MHCLGNFFCGKSHSFGHSNKLILYVILAVNNGNDVCVKFLYGSIYAQKINVHFFSITAKNARNVAVIDGIDHIFFMHIPNGAAGLWPFLNFSLFLDLDTSEECCQKFCRMSPRLAFSV